MAVERESQRGLNIFHPLAAFEGRTIAKVPVFGADRPVAGDHYSMPAAAKTWLSSEFSTSPERAAPGTGATLVLGITIKLSESRWTKTT